MLFMIGFICGAAVMILTGLYLVAKPKTRTKPQPTGIAAGRRIDERQTRRPDRCILGATA